MCCASVGEAAKAALAARAAIQFDFIARFLRPRRRSGAMHGRSQNLSLAGPGFQLIAGLQFA
jgi:hypothetical protein